MGEGVFLPIEHAQVAEHLDDRVPQACLVGSEVRSIGLRSSEDGLAQLVLVVMSEIIGFWELWREEDMIDEIVDIVAHGKKGEE